MSSSSAAAIGSYRLGFMGLGWALGLINASLTHAGFQIRVWPGTKCKLRARLRGVRQAIVDVCHKKGPSRVSNNHLGFVHAPRTALAVGSDRKKDSGGAR